MSKLLNAIGTLGIGIAAVAGTVNVALYNGKIRENSSNYFISFVRLTLGCPFSSLGNESDCHPDGRGSTPGPGTCKLLHWRRGEQLVCVGQLDLQKRRQNPARGWRVATLRVDGGHRAVIFDRFQGVKEGVVGEGTHFLIPWVQRPIIFDCRSRPRNVPTITGSKDLQNVNITLRVLFRPVVTELPKIYVNLGQDYDERVLPSITNEVLKAVVAQFDASEMITQREIVSQKVSEDLTERAKQFGLILDDISLTHLTFGKEFTEAVELKQVAQQDAERARFMVEKAEMVKQAAVIRAEGDALGAELLAKSFRDCGDGLVELRKLEAAEDIAYQMSRSRNVTYLPTGQQTLLALPQ
ncbi:hypothetical protein FSP39_016899 [Pinctada imbricata]|uniref:Band 7 domain-containing protein n=1 Tax=Pinctada imbricata TaxID=66713 RepID=A0AA88XD83_PINIB|nr:hypothetical protein FSP39_016899 [Pinctada imbricata]